LKTLIGFASILALVGCGGGSSEKKVEAKPEPPPAVVKVTSVAQTTWPQVYEATGTVHARTSAIIAAKVMGYVREMNVTTGSHVTAGQLLAVIDARDLETGLRAADAGLAEAKSMVPEVEGGVAVAKAQLVLAQATFKRMQDLANKKSISDQEFDEATARLHAAKAGYDAAAAKRAQVKARIDQATEQKGAAEVTLSFARLTAPFSGVVTTKPLDIGTLATPGSPLMTIERDGRFRLEVAVEESRLVRPGDPVTVSIDGIGQQWAGRVAEVVPSVDMASRSYTVKIDLPASKLLRSGLFGRATFAAGELKTLTVPAAAVVERGQLKSVLVAENGRARARLVTTGQAREGATELLSGVAAGESVIVPVPANLLDGARVEIGR
jgi:membrane fusion protein, multidrug efflux system